MNDPQDNCPVVYNPSQANGNGEPMLLPKPTPVFNDSTNPAGDNQGDACDGDIDGDGIANGDETSMGLSPYVWDTDGERTNDGTEIACGSNPLSAASNLSGPNADNDGLPDACEVVYGTNPALQDTDDDGVKDGVEVRYWMSNPLVGTNHRGDGATDRADSAPARLLRCRGDRLAPSPGVMPPAQGLGSVSPGVVGVEELGRGVPAGAVALLAAGIDEADIVEPHGRPLPVEAAERGVRGRGGRRRAAVARLLISHLRSRIIWEHGRRTGGHAKRTYAAPD